MTICFDTTHDFCKSSYNISYDNFPIEIKRGAVFEQHNLFIETQQADHNKPYEAALRFLSELAWLFNTKVNVLFYNTTSSKPQKLVDQTRGCFNRIGNSLYLDLYKQVASDDKQKLALGIYREGLSSDSSFYSFLCYFRIINMKYETGEDQIRWINTNVSTIKDERNTVNYLSNQKIVDIGDHLYKSGRCAVAHASLYSGADIADPNNFEDNKRISRELPLIKELAELLVTRELKVPTRFEALEMWREASRRC